MSAAVQERARAWAAELRAQAAEIHRDDPVLRAFWEERAREVEAAGEVSRPVQSRVPDGLGRRFQVLDEDLPLAQGGRAVDAPLWQVRRSRRVTVRQLWAEFCATGCARIADWDEARMEQVAHAMLRRAHPALAPGALAAAATPDVFSDGVRSARLGFGGETFACPANAADDPYGEVDTYGDWVATLIDLSEVGAGTTRRLGHMNLAWENLEKANGSGISGTDVKGTSIGKQVPPPAEVHRRMAQLFANEPLLAVFAFSAWLLEVTYCPTLLTLGGGGPFDSQGFDEFRNPGLQAAFTLLCDTAGTTFQWQKARLGLSTLGFDRFYWQFPPRIAAPGPLAHPAEERLYAEYLLNVWTAAGASDFLAQSARRKALAVAAYARGIGEAFAQLDTFLQGQGDAFTDVVPYFELGNEMDKFYSAVSAPGQPAYDGVYEVGRLLALLAGPIRAVVPTARFRMFELAAWVGPRAQDNTAARATWLRHVVTVGLEESVAAWSTWQAEWNANPRTASTETQEWAADCVAANFWWPDPAALLPAATDLIHQAGLHWYNAWSVGRTTGANEYFGPWLLREDLQSFATSFTGHLDTILAGFQIGVSVCEIGFPARGIEDGIKISPFDPPKPTAGWYEGATPGLQANVYARHLLTALASGAQVAMIWTWMVAPTEATNSGFWEEGFGLMGVRNDEIVSGDGSFSASLHAWRRPAWYTFQRLSALIGRSGALKVVHSTSSADGVVAIKLRPLRGSYLYAGRAWSHAYVFWMDQDATTGSDTIIGAVSSSFDWVLAPLIPAVTAPTDGAPVSEDPAGYPLPADVSWEWTDTDGRDWRGALSLSLTLTEETASLEVSVGRIEVDRENVGLAVVFTNGPINFWGL